MEIKEIVNWGIDEANRVIYFGGPLDSIDSDDESAIITVSQKTVERVVRAIQTMASKSKKTITLHLQSYGGDPYSTLYLIDVIRSTPVPIHCVVGGAVMSAATWIVAACDYRAAYPNTTFLIHAGSLGTYDDMVSAEIFMDEQKRVQNLLVDIYASNSRVGSELWAEVSKRDLFISAEEALTLGLIDEIIQPVKRGQWRAKRIANLNKKINQKQFKQLIQSLLKRIKSDYKGEIKVSAPTELFEEEVAAESETHSHGSVKNNENS